MIMRWLRTHFMLVLIYGTCLTAGTQWVRQWIRFRGVQDWPSVAARIVNQGSTSIPYQIEDRHGSRTGRTDASFVAFEYSVNGNTYSSNLATPDGGGLPFNPFGEPWRAFYKPGSPHLAVLLPSPYQGTGWLLTTLVSGMLVGIHLFFTVPDQVVRFRLWKLARRGR